MFVGAYGCLLALMGVCWRLWAFVGAYGRLLAFMGVYGRLWAFVGMDRPLWVLLVLILG